MNVFLSWQSHFTTQEECQWSILPIFPILNCTSVLTAYVTNDSFWACKIASKHSLQAGVPIFFGFSQKLSTEIKSSDNPFVKQDILR